MKRLHLHVSVPDIDQAVAFYSTLFGAVPSVVKDDYAKWMLEDPRVNLAISSRARRTGIDHVGVQVDNSDDLAELATRLKAAGNVTFDQEATTCCYAKSTKVGSPTRRACVGKPSSRTATRPHTGKTK